MWGKSQPTETGSTATEPKAAPSKTSGPMMMLKSLGFDPNEFMTGINEARAEYERAKVAAIQTTAHFDKRLNEIEDRLAGLEVMLRLVVSNLKVQIQPNETEHNIQDDAEAMGKRFQVAEGA